MKKIVITGINGQDGSYMADFLLEHTDVLIFGVVRRAAKPDYSNIADAMKNPRFSLVVGDLSDSQSIHRLVADIQPDYFINFAAQSFVASSWQVPEQTMDVNATGVMRCLEAIIRYAPDCRFYNAGSSEEFGDVQYSPQDEKHPLRARSPYGASKISARQIVKTYRESYNLYAIQGYLFNHESPRRGEEFVTRKITQGVAKIAHAIQNNIPLIPTIELGNLDAKRDWSHAKDFVEGVWMMLNQDIYRLDWKLKREGAVYMDNASAIDFDECKDIKEYVLSSNETHSIREFIELAFESADIEGFWYGNGINQKFCLSQSHLNCKYPAATPLVAINPKFYRPAEVELLLGNSSLARQELGWQPKYNFQSLVKEMVENDLLLHKKNV